MIQKPTIPISMIPAKTPVEFAKRALLSIASPNPWPPITISVTRTTIKHTGIAICSPVNTWGSAAGRMTSKSTCRLLAPRLRADQISSFSTFRAAAQVAMMI